MGFICCMACLLTKGFKYIWARNLLTVFIHQDDSQGYPGFHAWPGSNVSAGSLSPNGGGII
jgi:hypothetical protein